jgi:hypothetical protein
MVCDLGRPSVLLPLLLALLLSLATATAEESALIFTGAEVWRLIFAFARVPFQQASLHSGLAGTWHKHLHPKHMPSMAGRNDSSSGTQFFCGSAVVLQGPDGSGPLFLQHYFQQLLSKDLANETLAAQIEPGFCHTWGRSHSAHAVVFVQVGPHGRSETQCVVSTAPAGAAK